MNQAVEVVNEVKASDKSTFMKRVWAKMGKEEKGFTLIELLAVLVIIAIIAVIAVPLIGGIINNSKKDSDLATARQVYDASRLYVVGEKKGDFNTVSTINVISTATGDDTLQGRNYVDNPLYLPSDKKAVKSGVVTYKDGVLVSVTLVSSTDKSTTYSAAQILEGDRNATAPKAEEPKTGS